MSRIEECYKTVKEVDEAVNTLTDRIAEPGFSVEPGEFLMASFELAKVSLLEDIAKSLAMLADGLSDN